jgi:hypothetical protein
MKEQTICELERCTLEGPPTPYSLRSTQEWFAGIITGRMDENSQINPISPQGMLIAEEAKRYIAPSPTLRPHQRIQIYNQQYWWRLLNAMQENFPLVTRLFGYQAFNEEIAIPYLLAYPPNHWSLGVLGDRLSKWAKEHYHAPDYRLVRNAIELDWAFTASFIAAHYEPLNFSILSTVSEEELLDLTLYLQPHLYLFHWNCDLFAFREEFIKKDVDYWTENDFPSLPKDKTYRFVLFRSSTDNQLYWREASAGEFYLLQMFQKGSTINQACEFIETQEPEVCEEALQNLHGWMQSWTARGWLTLEKSSPKLFYKPL